jgi:hypothetical protein
MGYDFCRGRSVQNGIENHKSACCPAAGRTDFRLRWRGELQQRIGHDSCGDDCSCRTDSLNPYGRKSAGCFELDEQQWRDRLSRQAGDHERRTLHPNSFAYCGELHRYWTYQRHELFLRRVRAECVGREREFESGICHASLDPSATTNCSHRTHVPRGDGWESTDYYDLGCQ